MAKVTYNSNNIYRIFCYTVDGEKYIPVHRYPTLGAPIHDVQLISNQPTQVYKWEDAEPILADLSPEELSGIKDRKMVGKALDD